MSYYHRETGERSYHRRAPSDIVLVSASLDRIIGDMYLTLHDLAQCYTCHLHQHCFTSHIQG